MELISKQEARTEILSKCELYILSKEAHGEGQEIWSDSLVNISDVINALNEIEPVEHEDIIHCSECKYYGCRLYQDTQFECGVCFAHVDSDYTFDVKPYDFCSKAERKNNEIN